MSLPREPYAPYPFEGNKAVFRAARQIAAGEANAQQQQRFFHALIHDICRTYDLSYRPGGLEGDRDTAFAEGMRWVGSQLVKMTKTTIGDEDG